MSSACLDYLESLRQSPPSEGILSLEHGFLPPERTRARLPASHQAWDAAAAELPQLFFSNHTQAVLESLPLLPAGADSLPARDLTRASVVLSALAHAYWRFGSQRFYAKRITEVPGALPSCLLEPWRTVSRRLGRHDPERPFQSFYDLFLCNYALRAGERATPAISIENIDVLVPSFGNQAERVFYAAFVEMHRHFTPIIAALCQLETGLANEHAQAVIAALEQIARCFERAAKVWKKIGARPGSDTYCDPVVWSKTVAILGVAPVLCPQGGTSGACAPVVYVMDALCRRSSFETYYGQYLQQDASPLVPKTVHQFAKRVRALPLDAYLERRRAGADGPALEGAMQHMLAAYAGRTGWLGRHVSKAFSYLCISTITGRNASVSGHERYFTRQTWEQAARNLDASRLERGASCPLASAVLTTPATSPRLATTAALEARTDGVQPARCPFQVTPETAFPAPDARGLGKLEEQTASLRPSTYTKSEVARHHHQGDLWIIVDGSVYDLSRYQPQHPGGAFILQAYAGQDVTHAFWSQNVHSQDIVARILQRCHLGTLSPQPAHAEPAHTLLLSVLRIKQALRIQFSHAFPDALGLKLYSDEQAHMQLWLDKLPAAYASLADDWGHLVSGACGNAAMGSLQWVSASHDLRTPLIPELTCLVTRRCTSLQAADEALVERLFDATLACVQIIEHGAAPEPELKQLLQRFREEICACLETLTDDLTTLHTQIDLLFSRSVTVCHAAA